MLSGSSGVGSGLGSQPSCSAQQPPPRNLLLPPRSCSLSLPAQEDFFQSFNGGCCDVSNALGAELVGCNYSIPDPQLVRRIVAQVEFYLSDENLAKDAFLLKHVQKNKMGFVSIKLLTSFKKVKYLTRDWRLTLYALRFSALLEVNEEGTKVRRRVPVPEALLNVPPSKLLLAWELLPQEQEVLLLSPPPPPPPLQKNFLETVTRMFSPFGAISSIRILRPGRKLPSDVRRYAARFPELLSKCCALVEYESLESARRAFEDLGHQSHPAGESIRVVRLCGKCPKKKPGAERELEERPARKAQAAPGFSCSLGGSLLCSSPEKEGPLASPPNLPQKDPPAPAWPSSDRPGAFSEAFTGLLLASKIFPPLEPNVGGGFGPTKDILLGAGSPVGEQSVMWGSQDDNCWELEAKDPFLAWVLLIKLSVNEAPLAARSCKAICRTCGRD
ncbi:la-related protein 6-like [Apus apus]|uniref:la-related protein 6-like n=1 Tax=Apus apus TaxID=8895 RepID=UPI0021F82BAC|nr:la-related protein 6-like [Apus apus]